MALLYSSISPIMKHFLLTVITILVGFQSKSQNDQRLIPAPQQIKYLPGKFLLSNLSVYVGKSDDEQVIFALKNFVKETEKHSGLTIRKVPSAAAATLQYKVLHKGYELPDYNPSIGDNRRESYTIKITVNKIYIEAYAGTGLYYALQTLRQMLELNGKASGFPLAEIADAPKLQYRGVMMDFAHGGLLRTDEIKKQIDFLATWKANQYYFYNEVSIRLEGYAGLQYKQSYTQAELKDIIAYGKERHIDVIPFVAFYGHLHDLLKNETYANLAIGNYGHELDPRKPEVAALLKKWIKQYADLFPSPFIHIGFDETWETNRISTEKEPKINAEKLWIDQLTLLSGELKKYNKTVLAWTDMTNYYPELMAKIPENVIPVIWEYSPDTTALHNFMDPVLKANKKFFIQPAVSGWGHIYPAATYTYDNIDLCLEEGIKKNTLGFITSVWTDAVEPFVRPSWSFMAYGCISAWQGSSPDRKTFEQDFYRVLFDTAGAKAQQACANLATAIEALKKCLGRNTGNMPGGTIIESWSNPFQPYYMNIVRANINALKQVRIKCEEAEHLLVEALPQVSVADKDFMESLRVTARLMHYEATRFLWANVISQRWDEAMLGNKKNSFVFYDIGYICHGLIQDVMDELGTLRDDYSAAWLSEYMPYRKNTILGRFDVEYGLWQKLLLKLIDFRIQHPEDYVAPQSFTDTFKPDF